MEIFIDESGTLPDRKDPFVVFAAVASSNPKNLNRVFSRVRLKLPPKGKVKREREISEIKFRDAGDRTRSLVISGLIEESVDIFILVIEKGGRTIEDSPKNYAKLIAELIKLCKSYYDSKIKKVILDKHFDQTEKLETLTLELARLTDMETDKFDHVDSVLDIRVNLADFVAGSTLWERTGKDPFFKEIINRSGKVKSEIVRKWRENRRW